MLAPGGGLGLMVYAPHGRTGVYMIQDARRLLAPREESPATRLDAAKRVMRLLTETAWLRHNRFFDDPINGGDAGLYDLLLNPRDVSFTVPALYSLLADAGLEIACWMELMRYDPLPLLPDPRLRARAEALGAVDRAALAEALEGNMSVHIIYCVRASEAPARARDAGSGDGQTYSAGRRHHHGIRPPARACDPAASGRRDSSAGRRPPDGRRDRRVPGATRRRRRGLRSGLAGNLSKTGGSQPAAVACAGHRRFFRSLEGECRSAGAGANSVDAAAFR